MRLDTPPSSIRDDDEITEDFDEDEMIYVGDLDEVLEDAEAENPDDSDAEENADPPKDDSILVFNRHSGSVFCGDIHPLGKIAVTGGEDDKAYVWNTETGEVLLECTDHEDSVVFTKFSSDGTYLATGDMGGSIKVHKCPSEDSTSWRCVWDYQAGDLSWGEWHSGTKVLFCGTISGEIYIWKIPSGDTKVLQGHGQVSTCGVLLPDGRRLATAYDDGSVKIWDIKSATVVHHITSDQEESASISSIDAYHDNNLIATGCLNAKACLIKSATGKPVGVLDTESAIEAVSFSKDPALGFLAIGTIDGSISIWDVGRQIIRHKCASGTKDDDSVGVTSLLWIKNYLAVACLDGSVKIYEGKSGTLMHTLTGHRAELLDITYSTASNCLLTTSEDGTSRIFKVDLS